MQSSLLAILVASTMALSACVGTGQVEPKTAGSPVKQSGASKAHDWVPPDVKWDTSGRTSKPLAEGLFKSLPVQVTTFPSAVDGSRIQTAFWRPDVPEGTKVPVILEVGPYFGDEIENPLYGYWGDLLIDGLLPHGFAYGQVAVRGTSGSGGCQEFFSLKEQKDIDAAVTFYGSQPWSNGNVALIGISYDGTTTWISAVFGNPHLKTIVPIAGLTSIYDHSFRNGTAWATAPLIHTNYWTYGFTHADRAPPEFANNAACPEEPRGLATSTASTLTGERDEPPVFDGYWAERDFKPRILENYQGSVFLVTGILDWRVPPYLAFPFMQDLQAKGLDTKMLLGYWWHEMPDDASRRQHLRWDYAEMLLRWFQRYLYEDPRVNTGPAVDVEDNQGAWRSEENWPPTDATWSTYHLGSGTLKTEKTPAGDAILFGPASAHRLATDRLPSGRSSPPLPVVEYEATTGPLVEDLRMAGLPRLHVTFVPTSPEGARVYAELFSRDPNGGEHYVGHAVMDLRYYQGGYQRHMLTPNAPIVAKMEFLPLDARIPAGHELVLHISGSGYSNERLTRGLSGALDQWHESPTPLPVRIAWGDGKSVLELPLILRDVGDGKYPGQP